ncbi:unnamed protein product [Rotaria magnacalcarata]
MSSFNINTAEQLSTTVNIHLNQYFLLLYLETVQSFSQPFISGNGWKRIDLRRWLEKDWLEEMVGEGLFRLTAANGLKTSANVSTKISINSLIFSSAKDSTTVGFYPTNRSIAMCRTAGGMETEQHCKKKELY